MRAQAGRTVGAAAGGDRRGMKRIDVAGGRGAETDVSAAAGRDLTSCRRERLIQNSG